MSASLTGVSVLTLPPWALLAEVPSTRRSVTGSTAKPLGSARRSTMPNGAAANLARGGMAPVATAMGKLSALRSVRPAAS